MNNNLAPDDQSLSQPQPPANSSPHLQSPSGTSSRAPRKQRRLMFLAGVMGILVVYACWNSTSMTRYWTQPSRPGDLFPSSGSVAFAQSAPAFDMSKSIIPVKQIRSGGPPKDGIPAISDPAFVAASQASFLKPDDRVIGVTIGTEARAYPLRILNYHEIVNDRLGKTPVAVTYCPLCDSSVVFDRRTPLGELEFGVSGLLYNSNVLMYDRNNRTESLWSQLKATGVTGPGANMALKTLPLEVTSWQSWFTKYPQTKVLSDRTGHARDYSTSPYVRYFRTPALMFPVDVTDDRLPAKTAVLGVWTEKGAKAYPINGFQKEELNDQIGSQRVTLTYDAETATLLVTKADPEVEWMYSFWFAWAAFRPETDLYRPQQAR